MRARFWHHEQQRKGSEEPPRRRLNKSHGGRLLSPCRSSLPHMYNVQECESDVDPSILGRLKQPGLHLNANTSFGSGSFRKDITRKFRRLCSTSAHIQDAFIQELRIGVARLLHNPLA